jgi:hypothetical protein
MELRRLIIDTLITYPGSNDIIKTQEKKYTKQFKEEKIALDSE